MRWTHAIPLGSLVALGAWLLALNGCQGPDVRAATLERVAAPLAVDAHLEVARRYAPILFHAADEERWREDIPARVDFDGNLRGDDNWENLQRFELEPVVYYTVLETGTHLFLTYHLFHPRDWAPLRLGVHDTHEGDGENLQVVVDKASGRPVLLLAQAHYCGLAWAGTDSGFGAGDEEDIQGPFALLGADGRPAAGATHVAAFVESEGHGILSATDSDADVAIGKDGAVALATSGVVLLPSQDDAPAGEPPPGAARWPYRLESTAVKIWPGVADGTLLGEDGLLDGTCMLEAAGATYPVPRYYEGDRFSGPLGADRGISPFAVDFGFSCGTVGALYFDPARRYATCLRVPSPWSTTYVARPF